VLFNKILTNSWLSCNNTSLAVLGQRVKVNRAHCSRAVTLSIT